jgi:hypothetical protein
VTQDLIERPLDAQRRPERLPWVSGLSQKKTESALKRLEGWWVLALCYSNAVDSRIEFEIVGMWFRLGWVHALLGLEDCCWRLNGCLRESALEETKTKYMVPMNALSVATCQPLLLARQKEVGGKMLMGGHK